MFLPPPPHSFHLLRTAKVVAVLRLLPPAALRVSLARLPARRLRAKMLSGPGELRGNEELAATGTLARRAQRRHHPTLPVPPLRIPHRPLLTPPSLLKKRRRTDVAQDQEEDPATRPHQNSTFIPVKLGHFQIGPRSCRCAASSCGPTPPAE